MAKLESKSELNEHPAVNKTKKIDVAKIFLKDMNIAVNFELSGDDDANFNLKFSLN